MLALQFSCHNHTQHAAAVRGRAGCRTYRYRPVAQVPVRSCPCTRVHYLGRVTCSRTETGKGSGAGQLELGKVHVGTLSSGLWCEWHTTALSM